MKAENAYQILQMMKDIKRTKETGEIYCAIDAMDAPFMNYIWIDAIYFPGSFNPPTYSHLEMMNEAIKKAKAKCGYFVISLDHTEGKDCNLESIAHRIIMLSSWCAKDHRLGVLIVADGRFINMVHRFKAGPLPPKFICGCDIMPQVAKHNTDEELSFIFGESIWMVAPRDQAKFPIKLQQYWSNNNQIKECGIYEINRPIENISSTQIRKMIKERRSIIEFTGLEIANYVFENDLYD